MADARGKINQLESADHFDELNRRKRSSGCPLPLNQMYNFLTLLLTNNFTSPTI